MEDINDIFDNGELEKNDPKNIKIILTEKNNELDQQNFEFFLSILNKQYKNWKEKKKKQNDKFNEYSKHINKSKGKIYCDFENSKKKSPLTIIDGVWGSGKTYFLETLIKKIIFKEDLISNFTGIIMSDLSSFSYNNSITESLSKNIIDNFGKIFRKNKLIKTMHLFLDQISNILSSTTTTLNIGVPFFSFSISKKIKKQKSNWEKLIKKISKIKIEKPIILILDNIERLGNKSWDVMKVIFKLQEFPNLLIILPMNKKQLIHRKIYNNEEIQIYKYLDFPIIELENVNIKNIISQSLKINNEILIEFCDFIIKKNYFNSLRELKNFLDQKYLEIFSQSWNDYNLFKKIYFLSKALILNNKSENDKLNESIMITSKTWIKRIFFYTLYHCSFDLNSKQIDYLGFKYDENNNLNPLYNNVDEVFLETSYDEFTKKYYKEINIIKLFIKQKNKNKNPSSNDTNNNYLYNKYNNPYEEFFKWFFQLQKNQINFSI